jgi:hypothetical protein
VSDLHSRGSRIFGATRGEVCWPYGLNDQTCRFDPKADREGCEAQRDLTQRQRLTIVDWAEHHGLRASSSGCCPIWLTRDKSRRCGGKDTRGCGGGGGRWSDHALWWIKDRRPVAITGAPYHFDDDSQTLVDRWLTEDERLNFTTGAGWYGYGTTQVVLWRTDRIKTIEPAKPEDGASA